MEFLWQITKTHESIFQTKISKGSCLKAVHSTFLLPFQSNKYAISCTIPPEGCSWKYPWSLKDWQMLETTETWNIAKTKNAFNIPKVNIGMTSHIGLQSLFSVYSLILRHGFHATKKMECQLIYESCDFNLFMRYFFVTPSKSIRAHVVTCCEAWFAIWQARLLSVSPKIQKSVKHSTMVGCCWHCS